MTLNFNHLKQIIERARLNQLTEQDQNYLDQLALLLDSLEDIKMDKL